MSDDAVDFNDVAKVADLDAVRRQVSKATRPDAVDAKAPKPRKSRKAPADLGVVEHLLDVFALEYCSGFAWNTETGRQYTVAGLRIHFGSDEVRVWLAHPRRRTVHPEDVVFDPSETCAEHCVNLFRGWPMEPAPGNCDIIIELLTHLVGGDDVVLQFILNWIAYPLQNPGAKMPTSVIMHGDEGSGKNLFWEGVRDLYGGYGSVVGQDQLEDKFNDWLSGKLFIIGDEVLSRQEMRHLKGKLKAMISGREIKINTKMMPLRSEENHVNLVFLSNELQPNALDSSDRRYCVIWTPPKLEQEFYQRVVQCRNNGGREAFFHQLLQRDLSSFDPYAPPPATKAKADLIDLGRPNAERWWLAWVGDALPVPYRTCTAEQAYRLYRRWCAIEGERYVVANNVFARMVMRLASDHGLVTRPVKLHSGNVRRMWITAPLPDGVSVGSWAEDQCDAFEAHFKGYGDAS